MTEPKLSERGFKHFDPIVTETDETVRAYESSDASGPHLWLAVKDESNQAWAHLSLADAELLRDQLDLLIKHHYQLEERQP